MSLSKRILFSNDLIFNSYKRIIKHDKTNYIINIFKKSKYKKLLSNKYFKYNNELFYYFINTDTKAVFTDHLVDNISISYNLVVNKPLNELLADVDDKKFVSFIKKYFEKIKLTLNKENSLLSKDIMNTIDNFYTNKAKNLKDALQRILFINQLLWQTGHRLNGLGRLDLTLDRIYKESGINKEEAKKLILEFLKSLHKDYYYKSNVLKGDTGQIIIVGGLDKEGNYFSNDLSYLFIECVKELQLPDPKTLLRVSNNMPDDLLKLGLESIKTGCGSPLLSNDEIVIKKLLDIGYTEEDAANYATSACWEPLCDGKSFEQNNIADLNFVSPLNELLADLNSFNNFNDVIDKYFVYLEKEINKIIDNINNIQISYDPLISLYLENCNINKLDVSKGGAKYSNYGVLTSGLGNLIDSLLNIKKYVFDENRYSLMTLINEKNNNFTNESILNDLKNNDLKYGCDDPFVIELTNKIIDFTNSIFIKYNNKFNGVFRFGLSSPNYIINSKNISASLDGRKNFEPFNVHISSTCNIGYTEIINFASKLNYGKRNVNGNVCDLILSKRYLDNNFDDFYNFIKTSISLGFFQIQFNVIDSKTLIDAQQNPEAYKNLIVRVWGFSAYFIELPIEYQNLLIRRSQINEGIS